MSVQHKQPGRAARIIRMKTAYAYLAKSLERWESAKTRNQGATDSLADAEKQIKRIQNERAALEASGYVR